MTEQELRNSIVKTAKSYIGKKAGSAEHKFIVDTYNKINPLPRSYKVKYSDDWCATFVSAIAVLCGLNKIFGLECSCEKQIEQFKKLGAFNENDAYVPAAGDVIYYDWQDDGKGDNQGWSDHVGIVESVNNGVIRVIEGNNSGGVNYRNISVNGRYIRGFGVPKYASIASPAKTETELAKEWAIKNGIFKGYGNGDYGWKNPVTREQIAIVLYRLYGQQK